MRLARNAAPARPEDPGRTDVTLPGPHRLRRRPKKLEERSRRHAAGTTRPTLGRVSRTGFRAEVFRQGCSRRGVHAEVFTRRFSVRGVQAGVFTRRFSVRGGPGHPRVGRGLSARRRIQRGAQHCTRPANARVTTWTCPAPTRSARSRTSRTGESRRNHSCRRTAAHRNREREVQDPHPASLAPGVAAGRATCVAGARHRSSCSHFRFTQGSRRARSAALPAMPG